MLSDTTIFRLYGDKVISSLKKLDKPVIASVINPGEKHKTLSEIPRIIKPYFEAGFNRNACFLALGGGVITDLGGFIASILLRGIATIYLPTTLLGQIDAAIGGKTGVNFQLSKNFMIKNMLGTIIQPAMVISDIDTLFTLPQKEILNGLGEMMKYYIGWEQPSVAQLLKIKQAIKTPPRFSERTPRVLEETMKIISICQHIKLDIVQADPAETKGIRGKLNLGHTIGHAIEGAANGRISHGEGVSIGLAAAARLSVLKGLLKEDKYKMIIAQLKSLCLPTAARNIDRKKVLSALKLDKKGGTFVLIQDVGNIKTNQRVDLQLINQVLSEIIV